MNVDRGRLIRALRLDVVELEAGRYRVTGGRAPHIVEVGAAWTCDCFDASLHRSARCKHTLAVYLTRRLAPAVLQELREVVLASAEKPTRRRRRARA